MEFPQLGPYRIEKEIGRGGMGTVYAAIDETTEAKVAVKVLAPLLANQEGFRDRFEAEIESLKELQHPHIVKIYAFGQQAGYLYYAMELVDGCSLEDELFRRRRFQWQEVCRIGIDLCRALKLAHDHGIIHRDIKPANLLWSKKEMVKLSDFGIARLFGNSGFTSEGGVLGTAEYMAPEQADGNPVTHHCDLYSLGGVLYALIVGRPPFQSKSMLKLLQMQRFSQPESVCKYAPDTPLELEQIIMQLLEKNPDDRFPNALLVARRMEAMQRALSQKSENDQVSSAQVNSASGFEIHPYDAENPDDEIGATLDIADVDQPVDSLNRKWHENAGVSALDSDQGVIPNKEDHFTTIEDERRERENSERQGHPLISLPTWLLAAALVLTAFVGWYFLQPPSADLLYQRIEQAEESGRLIEAKEDVNRFLKYYRQDPRAQRVGQYQSAIEGFQLKGRAILQARLLNKKFRNSPVGPDYLAIIEQASTDPETAARQLRALISLYSPLDNQEPIKVFVSAAKNQLPYIEEQAKQRITSERKLLDERLRSARDAAEQHPEKTRTICTAICTLYRDKIWARSLVQQAEQLLKQISDNQSNADISSSQ